MPDPYERLIIAASQAQNVLTRVGSEGGIAEAIGRGDWNRTLGPQQATDLADLLGAMTEHVRHAREVADNLRQDTSVDDRSLGSVEEIVVRGLPLNRKERFYTGTVLPMIVASDGFAHMHRFLALCGLSIEPLGDHGRDGVTQVEFFSEYNFAESRFTDEDKARFPAPPAGADTPDLVILGADWLLAVEAKMFHDPPPSALNDQMRRQRVLLDYWAAHFGLETQRVAHVMLLPSQLPAHGVTYPVVTWETVLHEYQVVGPAYWTAMLATALNHYDGLRSRGMSFGTNADGRMTGQEIVNRHGDGELNYTHMGRRFGSGGVLLAKDLHTGNWRSQTYEVRYEPLPENPNWFAIADFIAKTVAP